MPDPAPLKLRQTRQGYREAAKRLAVMARRAESLMVALEDSPPELRGIAEQAAQSLADAYLALGAASRALHH